MTTPDQPGWYDDPDDPNAQRYWDGQEWTPHRQRKATSQPAPPPPPPPPNLPPPPPPPGYPPPQSYNVGAAEQGTGIPTQPPPPAWPPPNPQTQGAGAQMASDGLATVKGFAAKLSITAWLLFGGLVVAVFATFFPFATVSVNVFGATISSSAVSGWGGAQFGVLVLVAGAVALAWPTLFGSPVTVQRLIGLSVDVVLLVVLMVVWFTNVSNSNREGEGIVDVSPGFGLLLYGAGVVAVAIAVIRLWMDHSRAQKQSY
jgi:hypothetical protein